MAIETSAYLRLYGDFVTKYFTNVDPNSMILETGSGNGELLGFLKSKGFSNLHAVDIKDQLTEVSKEGINFCVKDLSYERLPYADNTFDFVVSMQVIEHIENPWAYMREVQRVLKKGGVLLISFPTSKDLFSKLMFLLQGNVLHYTRKNSHISFFTNDVQYKLFKGFTTEKEVYSRNRFPFIRFEVPANKLLSAKNLHVMVKE